MENMENKIELSLDGNTPISIEAFIAPIEHTAGNFHKKWGGFYITNDLSRLSGNSVNRTTCY